MLKSYNKALLQLSTRQQEDPSEAPWKKAKLEVLLKYGSSQNDPSREIQQYRCLAVPAVVPLEWWRSQTETYQRLSHLAREVLAIPATSAPSKRIFSAAGVVLIYKKSSLSPHVVDKVIFVHENGHLLEDCGDCVFTPWIVKTGIIIASKNHRDCITGWILDRNVKSQTLRNRSVAQVSSRIAVSDVNDYENPSFVFNSVLSTVVHEPTPIRNFSFFCGIQIGIVSPGNAILRHVALESSILADIENFVRNVVSMCFGNIMQF